MIQHPIIFLALSIVLSGCASGPKSPEEWATFYAAEAKTALAKGDDATAARQISNALERPTGDLRVKELFATTPKAQHIYFSGLERTVAEISSPSSAIDSQWNLNNARSANILSTTQLSSLQSALGRRVQIGNATGTITFDLTDKFVIFPELSTKEQKTLIAARTIKALQSNGPRTTQVEALMDYVREQGKTSEEATRIEALLPEFNIRRNEIGAVANLFPVYAASRKSEIIARVVVQVKNGDRLLSEDLLQALRSRVVGVEWVLTPSPKSIHLVIERIRSDEKILSERTETVTYAQHEVNLLAAALLMPRNASYLYDISSGGAEIEYGYAVTAAFEGRVVHDELVRGKVGGEFRRCQNSRIHNIFGGVTAASFVANDDMQRRCSGASSVSIENLRKDVFAKISDSVLKVPQIKSVHDLN